MVDNPKAKKESFKDVVNWIGYVILLLIGFVVGFLFFNITHTLIIILLLIIIWQNEKKKK